VSNQEALTQLEAILEINMTRMVFALVAALLACPALLRAQTIEPERGQKTVTVTAAADGTDEKAKDEATAQALRKAVEEACGTFIHAQTATDNYQAVYDKVIANTVGYVVKHSVVKIWADDEKTYAKLKVVVSTQRFEEDWATIAHTVGQEGNPRVLVAIVEATNWTTSGPAYQTEENGIVQSGIEDFFLQKNIVLVDRETSAKVSKRDLMLASMKDEVAEVAAIAARFKADVVVTGQASAKFGKEIHLEGHTMYQYSATLTVRVVQADSAKVLVSKTFGPITVNSVQHGAEEKALTKLAEEASPKLLSLVVEAWRKKANVSRMIELSIVGMDYDTWKTFEKEAKKIRGVQEARRREITESVANIDVEYKYSIDNLADNLKAMTDVKLEVVEITGNRIKLKVIK
jgi:hypothetical protein